MKIILRKTIKKQFKLKYQNQPKEQTLVTIGILQLIIDASIYQFTL